MKKLFCVLLLFSALAYGMDEDERSPEEAEEAHLQQTDEDSEINKDRRDADVHARNKVCQLKKAHFVARIQRLTFAY